MYTYIKQDQPSDKFDGDFVNNKKHGIGQMNYVAKGETYYGTFACSTHLASNN